MNILQQLMYTVAFEFCVILLLIIKTDAILDLKSIAQKKPKTWLVRKDGTHKRIIPKAMHGQFLEYKKKQYLYKIYNTGKIKETIIFEGTYFPIATDYMKYAMQLNAAGYEDLTQAELAVTLWIINKKFGYIPKPNTKYNTPYSDGPKVLTGLEIIDKEIELRGGNPWICLHKTVEDAINRQSYQNGGEIFDIIKNTDHFIRSEASCAEIESEIVLRENAIRSKEKGFLGISTTNWINIGIAALLVFIGIGYLASKGGINAFVGSKEAADGAKTAAEAIRTINM